MNESGEKQIIESWQKNAQPWITAVRQGEIKSRVLVTNKAIIDTILQRTPKNVLDVGCGEGWLVRELAGRGIDALGVDVVQDFIDIAMRDGCGRFQRLPYESVSLALLEEQFDVVVCNFSLFGRDSVQQLFLQIPALIGKGGAFIVQTLHPRVSCGEDNYEDGWRSGSWVGFSDAFSNPAPWYFRTIESWRNLFVYNGFTLAHIHEPINPTTQQPASIIFVGEHTG